MKKASVALLLSLGAILASTGAWAACSGNPQAGFVCAAPAGSQGPINPRALVASDIPSGIDLAKIVAGPVISPAQITGNQDDWAPTGFATAAVVRVSVDATTRTITGFQGGADGRMVVFENLNSGGGGSLIFPDDNSNSSAANRFYTGGYSAQVPPGGAAFFRYDGTESRWELVSYVPSAITQSQAENGTDTIVRAWTSQRVAQAIAAQSIADILEDATPQLGGDLDTNGFNILFDDTKAIKDDSGNELLGFSKQGSAVDFLTVRNSSGGNPSLNADGDSANVNILLTPKGGGNIVIGDKALRLATNDAASLGTAAQSWSDLFLASGGVVNWNNGDVTVTHASDALAFFGGLFTFDFSGTPVKITNTADNANNVILQLDSDRATPAGADIGMMQFRLSDSGGTQTEFARIAGQALTVTDGAEAGSLIFGLQEAGGGNTYELQLNKDQLYPFTNDGLALGSGSFSFADLFLASGGVINWNNGNCTLTHSAALLTSSCAVSLGTSNAITVGSIELGHASADTLTASGGDLSIEGNRIFRVGGADVPVADGGTNLSSGNSGGVLGFTASGTIASSAALAANGPVIGGGAGATPTAIAAGTDGQIIVGQTSAAPQQKTMSGDCTLAASGAITCKPKEAFCVAVSDETTAITTGTAKVTFRMPYAFTVSDLRASVNTVSSSGNPTFDINEGGTSIMGANKLSIDSSEKTSTTAATAYSSSDNSLADDAEMTIDIDTAGTGAKGAKVCIIGNRT